MACYRIDIAAFRHFSFLRPSRLCGSGGQGKACRRRRQDGVEIAYTLYYSSAFRNDCEDDMLACVK